MQRLTCFDFNKRHSLKGYYRYGPDEIEGLKIPWTETIYSIDGAHYHCWIPPSLTAPEQGRLLVEFKKAAKRKGDPVKFSYDFQPEGFYEQPNFQL